MAGNPRWWEGKSQASRATAEHMRRCTAGCERETALRALAAGHVTWTGLAPAVRTRLIQAGVRSGYWMKLEREASDQREACRAIAS